MYADRNEGQAVLATVDTDVFQSHVYCSGAARPLGSTDIDNGRCDDMVWYAVQQQDMYRYKMQVIMRG